MNSFPKIVQYGSRDGLEALEGKDVSEVWVQEKLDGSQFSFCRREDGEIVMSSARARVSPGDGNAMFAPAVETVMSIADRLVPGWVYRAEAFMRPKHNVRAYERMPRGGLILFDVEPRAGMFKADATPLVADELGLECAPFLSVPDLTPFSLDTLIDTVPSVLGGRMEGVVLKAYQSRNKWGYVPMVKYVDKQFKEVRWDKPPKQDFLLTLAERYGTEARYQKAVLHLREQGKIQGDMPDIGPLMKEVAADLEAEEGDAIRQEILAHYYPLAIRSIRAALPEWYRGELIRGME